MTLLTTKVAALLGLAASSSTPVWAAHWAPGPPALSPRDVGYAVLPRQAGSSNSTACATVSQKAAAQKRANPSATVRVTAEEAASCLASVPNKPAEAQKLVESVKAYVSWQSTLAYLKDPPESYGLPPVDIMGGMDAIAQNVSQGKFASEYDFQSAMVLLIAQAHDGHFAYRPDVFKAFSFRNDLLADMVSVSMDGKEMPKLYNFAVLNGSTTKVGNTTLETDSTGMPPAIARINGMIATEFIEQQGLTFINTQDRDSQWNAQFRNYIAPTGIPPVAGSILHQGNSVTVEYENRQTITQESYALLRAGVDFSGIQTGEDFYQKFLNPNNQQQGGTTQQAATPSAPTQVAPNIEGFPMPAIRDSGANATAGYFLTGGGYEDTAVLSVLGFAPSGNFDTNEYIINLQQMLGDFLVMSKQAGKTKLVVDVTGNGGGLVAAGFEMYSQLFPGQQLFQANNLRRSQSLLDIAQVANDNLDKLLAVDFNAIGRNATDEQLALAALASSSVVSNLTPGGVFSAGNAVNYTMGTQITSAVPLMGDSFTAYQSTPLNTTSAQFNLTGTGSRANPPAAVFQPENVVILTDGTCGSTCTIFSYLAIMQNNVKTVSVGGRPQPGPMQSMGGVEGAQVFELEDLQSAAAAAMFLATPEQQKAMSQSDTGIIAEGYALLRAASPGAAGAVNGKNAFSHTDAQVPLEFLNQPANCKFFYTKDMILGPEATWRRAADAAFKDPNQFCVEGSQMPLMGVQAPTQAFFTSQAAGGLSVPADAQKGFVSDAATTSAGLSSSLKGSSSIGAWVHVLVTALVSVALLS